MLYKRCMLLIDRLISAKQPLTTSQLAEELAVSPRTIRSDLDTIDRWLAENSLHPITRIPGLGILLPDADLKIRHLLGDDLPASYVMSSQERVRAITGWLLSRSCSTSIAKIAARLDVSPATVSSDLTKVREWMDRYCIHMVSKPHIGIAVQDTELNIRRGLVMLLRELLETDTKQQPLIGMRFMQTGSILRRYRMSSFCETVKLWREDILLIIQKMQEAAHVTISDNGFCAMFVYLLVAFARYHKGHAIHIEKGRHLRPPFSDPYGGSALRDLIHTQIGLDMPPDEIFLIHTEWMSLRRFGASRDINIENVLIAKELIAEVKESLEIQFEEGDDTILDLATHLSVMQYRLFLSIPSEHNPTLKEIEESFPDVCQVVRQKLWSILKERFGDVDQTVCDREAVYIAMYVVACILKNPLENAMKKDVVIVCNSTIATSKILENRLRSVFYNINIVDTLSYHEFISAKKPLNCDLVISTLPIESPCDQCITVNPLLNTEDVNRLTQMFTLRMQNIDLNKYISATINIAARSLELKPEERIKLSIELAKDIKEEVEGLDNKRKPTLRGLLDRSLVAAGVRAKSCYEAIQQAGELLMARGLIAQAHIDAMIKIKKKLGGYMVIDKGVALPHLLAPELETPCISVITLDKPVMFGHPDNDPVELVIMLLSNHNTAHIKILEELVDILGDEEKRDALRNARNAYELLGILS